MNKLLISLAIACCFLSNSALAEEAGTKMLKIKITGIQQYQDYTEILDGIRKMDGVTNLIASKISKGSAELRGLLVLDPIPFINDLQAFTMDRYKFEKKDTGDSLEITLKKL